MRVAQQNSASPSRPDGEAHDDHGGVLGARLPVVAHGGPQRGHVRDLARDGAGQQAQQVEVVWPLVEQHAPAREVRVAPPAAGHVLAAQIADAVRPHGGRRPQVARGEHGPRAQHRLHEPHLLVHRQHEPRPTRRRDHPPAVLERGGDGLLRQHVLAGRDGAQRHAGVAGWGVQMSTACTRGSASAASRSEYTAGAVPVAAPSSSASARARPASWSHAATTRPSGATRG